MYRGMILRLTLIFKRLCWNKKYLKSNLVREKKNIHRTRIISNLLPIREFSFSTLEWLLLGYSFLLSLSLSLSLSSLTRSWANKSREMRESSLVDSVGLCCEQAGGGGSAHTIQSVCGPSHNQPSWGDTYGEKRMEQSIIFSLAALWDTISVWEQQNDGSSPQLHLDIWHIHWASSVTARMLLECDTVTGCCHQWFNK